MTFFLTLILLLIEIYLWIIIASVILSWLVVFNVVNTQNQIVHIISDTLHRATEPVLGPIRRFLPNLGGIDISPLIIIILLIALRAQLLAL